MITSAISTTRSTLHLCQNLLYSKHMMTLATPLTEIPRIQAKYYPKLEKLGLTTVEDLLRHFPIRYDDLSTIVSVADAAEGQAQTVVVTVESVKTKRIPGRKLAITEAVLTDETGSLRATWFNQPYVENTLTTDEPMRMSGMIKSDKRGLFLASPDIEKSTRVPTSTGRVVPIYQQTHGLSSKWLRWQLQLILERITIDEADDPLPLDIRTREHFPHLLEAFRAIHFPDDVTATERATERFAFEDLFMLQIYALRSRALYNTQKAHQTTFNQDTIKDFVGSLPFSPTDAQRKASFQILKDMERETPMNRLLNGDVGAGKTLVATIAALSVVRSGAQVAILAPTEVLARQHFLSLLNLLKDENVEIGLLTGSYKFYGSCEELAQQTTRPKLLEKIKDGDISIIIGTHALIQEDVVFGSLTLVVVDEQHRFGVAQRARLLENTRTNDKNGFTPHLLTMTATPIPRTFSLALFGDLSVSILDEKPANRKPIKTAIVTPSKQKEIYSFIEDELNAGRQAYVILPLVEESKAMEGVKSAEEEAARLQSDVFPTWNVGILHGKMKSKEKETVMANFKERKIDILVATAVVEVGVDVPNATVMIIENAERFGLSQLHQFRGRVGRNDLQSYCFLFTKSRSNDRLKALERHGDGFKLAEIDLTLRGPGEFIGTRQSGLPDDMMKNITNLELVADTRQSARDTLVADPNLTSHPAILNSLTRLTSIVHME